MYIFRQTRSYVYVTHRHNFEIQNALVSKRRTLLNWKVLTNSVPLRQTSAFSSVSLTQHEKFFVRHAVSCKRGAALTSLHIDLHPHPQKKITCTTGVFLLFFASFVLVHEFIFLYNFLLLPFSTKILFKEHKVYQTSKEKKNSEKFCL